MKVLMVVSEVEGLPGYFYAKPLSDGEGLESIGHSTEQLIAQLDVMVELTDDAYAALLERLRSGN